MSLKSITPLYEACRDGNEEQVRNLLPTYSHDDLNRQESLYGGNTCLHVAAANGHDNIVKLLLERGCYRASLLNVHNQSAYDMAKENKKSTRLLFLRQDATDPSSKSSTRFYDQNAAECFDIIKVDDTENKATIQTYATEEERKHEMEYSASSKAMCQSRFCRFFVNRIHDGEPLDQNTIIKGLDDLLEQDEINNTNDYIKANELFKEYTQNARSIDQLLHLYTLETKFYRSLKQDCLPLALPLFINLPKLKERYFSGRVYRGMHMTHEQLSVYQIARETFGTLLQTRSFSSTSMDRIIAEQFAYEKTKIHEDDINVLFILDFPNVCDQAINLSRTSTDRPCLSEYEDEQEVLVLPWTLFEVTRVRKATEEDGICTIHLTNVIIPKKNLLSTFKWTWAESRKHFKKEKKLVCDCAFQKYKAATSAKK